MTRKDKAELHYQLIKLLTDCDTDEDFLERLFYARDIIITEIQASGVIEKRQEI